MLRAGYVALQDVPRTADHAPSRTIYTWRVTAELAIARLAAELPHAILNARLRLQHESDRHGEVRSLYVPAVLCFA